MSEASVMTTAVMSGSSKEYRQRRRQQMIRFYGATFATLIAARFVFRGVKSRKYVPSLFQANHLPPPFSKRGEAIAAIGYATALSTTSFAMLVFGGAWVADISSAKEFGRAMSEYFGGAENRKEIEKMELDSESQKAQSELSKLFESKN